MSKTPLTIFLLLIVVVGVIVFVAYRGSGSPSAATVPVESADRPAQQMFATNCGRCHTLAAGGTEGVVGPNLDEILPISVAAPSGSAAEVQKANEGNYLTTYGRVLQAVTCGLEGRMPKGILQQQDAREVASFVAAYAGQLGPDQGPLVPPGERKMPAPQPCTTGGGGSSSASASG
jgi:mono/diheme cytochrome c family protein